MNPKCHKCGKSVKGGRRRRHRKSSSKGGIITGGRRHRRSHKVHLKGGFLGPLLAALAPTLIPMVAQGVGKLFGKGMATRARETGMMGAGLEGGMMLKPHYPPEMFGKGLEGGFMTGGSREMRNFYRMADKYGYPSSLGGEVMQGAGLEGGKLYIGKKHHGGIMTGGFSTGGSKHRGAGSKRTAANNPWIRHVKEYARKHKIPYQLAISEARPSYKG